MNNRNTSLSMRRKNTMAITANNPSPNNKGSSTGSTSRGLSCSTPEGRRPTASPCNSDSDTASPIPFLCTQDGSYGETEVVWNYYNTPKAERETQSRTAQCTPLSRKNRKSKPKNKISQLNEAINKVAPKIQKSKEIQKNHQLLQDLLEMNKNILGFIEKTQKKKMDPVHDKSASEEDIFNSSGDSSPKLGTFTRSGSKCLRRNLLSSKYSQAEPEVALESDDSMNECLIRASQMVEEKVLKRNADEEPYPVKRHKIEQDSMDSILINIKLDSSMMKKNTNDSFDNCVGNLNDSALERLTQLPIVNESLRNSENTYRLHPKVDIVKNPVHHGDSTGWTVKELMALDNVPSARSTFSRHNSMPESPAAPSVAACPSTSGTALSRHSSMPWQPAHKHKPENCSSEDTTPLRCTPEEIRRKHQQAREKLMAKRLFPNGNQTSQLPITQDQTQSLLYNLSQPEPKVENLVQHGSMSKFQLKQPMNHQHGVLRDTEIQSQNRNENSTTNINAPDIKTLIEKKRAEALQKLKMKRQSRVP